MILRSLFSIFLALPRKKNKVFNVKQEVKVPFVPSHLIQVKASKEELDERIQKFVDRKRGEINNANIRDFCVKRKLDNDEDSCARIDAVLVKRKDSKGHLQGNIFFQMYLFFSDVTYLF